MGHIPQTLGWMVGAAFRVSTYGITESSSRSKGFRGETEATYWKEAIVSLPASLLIMMKFFNLASSGDADQSLQVNRCMEIRAYVAMKVTLTLPMKTQVNLECLLEVPGN